MVKKLILIMIFCSIFYLNLINAFEFKGFGDVKYGVTNKMMMGTDETSSENNFTLGDVTIYTTEQLTDRLDILVEFVFMPKMIDTDMTAFDIARLEAGYAFGDWLNIRAGKFHTPVGHYSNKIRHVRFFDSTIDRPELIKFEDDGGFLPLHQTGILFRGSTRTKLLSIDYAIMVSNGQRLEVGNSSMLGMIDITSAKLKSLVSTDNDEKKQLTASLTFRPDFLDGLGIGFSGYNSDISMYDITLTTKPVIDNIIQKLTGMYFYYTVLPLEVYGEYYIINNQNKSGNEYSSNAYFLQFSYEFNEKICPYIRYEDMLIDSMDTYFKVFGKTNSSIITAGIKYNLTEFSVLKLEYKNSKSNGMTERSENSYATQWAFQF